MIREVRKLGSLVERVCDSKRGEVDYFFCNCFNRALSARAPMPIRETGMKWALPVIVRYFVLLNAYVVSHTSVRLGMSKHQFIVGENHLKEWREEGNWMWDHNCQTWVSWDWASLLSQFTFASLLRMISALSVVGVNDNALNPIMRDSSAGKSNQLRTQGSITLKHSMVTILECIRTKEERVKEWHV